MKVHKKYKSIKEKIKKAFIILRKQGYFARINFKSCQGQAWDNIPKTFENVVYYHHADETSLKEFGYIYIGWKTKNWDASNIVNVFKSVGLTVDWNGDKDRRIYIH
jgi:hypothetical protein